MFDLKTVWPFIRPKLDAKLASVPPAELGHELAAMIRAEYPKAEERATLAKLMAHAAGELGV